MYKQSQSFECIDTYKVSASVDPVNCSKSIHVGTSTASNDDAASDNDTAHTN